MTLSEIWPLFPPNVCWVIGGFGQHQFETGETANENRPPRSRTSAALFLLYFWTALCSSVSVLLACLPWRDNLVFPRPLTHPFLREREKAWELSWTWENRRGDGKEKQPSHGILLRECMHRKCVLGVGHAWWWHMFLFRRQTEANCSAGVGPLSLFLESYSWDEWNTHATVYVRVVLHMTARRNVRTLY